jgi:hypothetical protein
MAQSRRSEMSVDDAWEDWAHFNWSDDYDMGYVEAAFRAGYEAGLEQSK